MPLPRRIGNYEILGKLGQGGMGAVFLARQISMDRQVALKILPPRLAKDQAYVDRFLREATSAGRISHPHLIAVYDFGNADGYHFLCMELVEGTTLKRWLKERGPLSESQALVFLRQTSAALQAAHDQGIVHRDVKPDNILVDRNGAAKLADLGLAKPIGGEADVTMNGESIGTPAYMSPEQARGEDVDQRSDLYSLGATFWHLLAGELLFQGPSGAAISVKHVTEPPRQLNGLRPDVSPALSAILDRLLAKRPGNRYQSAAELLADLVAVEQGRPPAGASKRSRAGARPGNPRRASERPRPERRQHPEEVPTGSGRPALPWVLGGGLALLLGLLAVMLTGRAPDTSQPRGALPTSAVEGAVPPPSPPPGPVAPIAAPRMEADARGMLDFALAHHREHPQDFAGTLAYLRKAQEAGTGTVVELEADQHRQTVTAQQQDWLERRWEESTAAVREAFAERRYDAALAALADLPLPSDLHERATGERRRIEAAGQQAIAQGLDAIRAALAGGELATIEQAFAAYDAIAYTRGHEQSAEAQAALRQQAGRLVEAAQERHRRQIRDLLSASYGGFVAAIADGRTQDAEARIRDLRKDPRLAIATAELDALQAVIAAWHDRQRILLAALAEQTGQSVAVRFGRQQKRLRLVRLSEAGMELQMSLDGKEQTMVLPVARLDRGQRDAFATAWQARSAADHMLVCIEALQVEAVEVADAALAQAGQHPLSEHLAEHLRAVRLGEAEIAAEEAWQGVAGRVSSLATAAEAETLFTDLQAYRQRHGGTDVFARQREAFDQAVSRCLELAPALRLTAGLVAHWTGDAHTPTSFLDSGPHGLDLPRDRDGGQHAYPLLPGPVGELAMGIQGRSSGSTEWSARPMDRLPARRTLQGHERFAIAVWLFCDPYHEDDAPPRAQIWGGSVSTTGQTWALGCTAIGDDWSLIGICGDGTQDVVRSAEQLPHRRWTHVVFSFDGTAATGERLRLIVDGERTTVAASSVDRQPVVPAIHLGKSDGALWYRGGIDDLRFYDRPLDASDAAALMALGQPRALDPQTEDEDDEAEAEQED